MRPVQVFTTTYCAFCVRAKAYLRDKGIPFEEIDVTGDDDARDALVVRSRGRRTVPQIFIGETAVGGYTDLVALDRAGELSKLLAAE